MKKQKFFVSYRNTMTDGTYKNFDLLLQLVSELKSKNPLYEFSFLPPERIPRGTLFSPYDMAAFYGIHSS